MQVDSVNLFNNSNIYVSSFKKQKDINFGAAKDINLRYIMTKHEKLLPERISLVIKEVLSENLTELPTLRELHDKTYKGLYDAETLDEVKAFFPEFAQVKDFTEIAKKFSRSARVISQKMPVSEFSLDCLKKIWSGMPQEEITKYYGFSCRDVLSKICKNLNIPKPEGNYLVLLKTSTEEGNRIVAEKTRRNIDICMKNLAFANIANKTPEARAKQAASMRKFYDEHPERREEVSLISKAAWDKCPHIKKAMSVFSRFQPSGVLKIIQKQKDGVNLSKKESQIILDFYKRFWSKFPNLKKDFSLAKSQAKRELDELKLKKE